MTALEIDIHINEHEDATEETGLFAEEKDLKECIQCYIERFNKLPERTLNFGDKYGNSYIVEQITFYKDRVVIYFDKDKT